jgi:hypothetical protein
VPSQPPVVLAEVLPADEPGADVGALLERGTAAALAAESEGCCLWWWWRWAECERGAFSVGVGERPSRETCEGAMEGASVGALSEKVE